MPPSPPEPLNEPLDPDERPVDHAHAIPVFERRPRRQFGIAGDRKPDLPQLMEEHVLAVDTDHARDAPDLEGGNERLAVGAGEDVARERGATARWRLCSGPTHWSRSGR